jgi:hypothetical protein
MIIELQREHRDHSFLPDDIGSVPSLYATEEISEGEKAVFLHYFIPNSMSAFDWWIVEYDPEQNLAFGFACLNGDAQNAEWGYINLEELENIHISRTVPPLVVIREVEFTPKPWHEVRAEWQRRQW